MFFTPELLSRRDSGFGLLWLAATLGARSSFNRLPKRDVMGADITQLCDLIAEPAEPLALRLSSNLMVGVARVYKVKHDIFLGDVSACFVSLKRAVRDLHALSASSHLQMGQPIVKRDAVTVNFDPLGLNLDDFLGDWQDIMDVQEEDGSDDEYGKPRKKPKSQDKRRPPHTEVGRATRHTLDENLEQMMSGSLEMSFLSGVEGEQQRLSPHMDTGFDFGDSEDFGFDVIGEELAKELGEGWASAPVHQKRSSEAEQQFSVFSDRVDANMDFGLDGDFAFTGLTQRSPDSPASGNVLTSRQSPSKKRNFDSVAADTLPQSPGDQPHVLRTPTPPWAFDTEVDGPGNGITGIVTERTVPSGEAMSVPRKTKRVRVQVDTRIELTNEELKKARAHYVEDQEAARRSIEGKRLEKEGSRLISQMLYGAPPILKAPVLVDFWMDNFKVLVEARSGALHMKTTGELPTERTRPLESTARILEELLEQENFYETHDVNMAVIEDGFEDQQEPRDFNTTRQRSSEEPGQARHASIGSFPTASAFNLGGNLEIGSGSHKSSLFPWDNAGLSSSAAGVPFDMGSDRISIGHDEVRLKDASVGRSSGRESSLVPSQLNSGPGATGFSPRIVEKLGTHVNASFEFDVPGGSAMPGDAPGMEPDLVTLERNSFNFLEYVKMQLQAVQRPSEGLAFDSVVPRETSTPHVAAAAFYHCLGEHINTS